MHNALCHAGGPVRNALCHRKGACAQRLIWGKPCAQRLVSPWGGVCATPCVAQRLVSGGGLCTMPCVIEGGPVRNALYHRGCLSTAPYLGEALRTTPCVTMGGRVRNALCHRGGAVHNALCHRGWGGACACGLVVSATDFLPVSHGLKSQGVTRGQCTTPCVTQAGACAQRLIWGKPCAQRLVSPGGALHTTPCVMGGRVPNALCRATPCVTEGGAGAQGIVSPELPVHNALCHRGGACAQRLVSLRGDLCTTPCVAQRLVSPRGGPCTMPCVAGGACAQRLVSGRVPVA